MQMAPASAPGGTARRRTWITLQAVRTADIHRDDDLGAALANSSVVDPAVARDELPTRTLDREEALSLIVGLASSVTCGRRFRSGARDWGAWNAGLTTQGVFVSIKWKEAEESARQLILHRLQMVPSLGTTVCDRRRATGPSVPSCSRMWFRHPEANRARLNNSRDCWSLPWQIPASMCAGTAQRRSARGGGSVAAHSVVSRPSTDSGSPIYRPG